MSKSKSKKQKHNIIVQTAVDLFDNRIFSLYLSFMGIALLTPTTLVPLGLALGGKYLSQLNSGIKNKSGGGNTKKSKLEYFKFLEEK